MTWRRTAPIATAALAAALGVLVPANVAADGVAPFEVVVVGEGPVRVRVAIGTTGPCSSTENTPLANAIVKPGAPLVVKTDAICMCTEQTFHPFTESGWSPASITCRPQLCTGGKKSTKCRIDMTAPFRVTLRSKE